MSYGPKAVTALGFRESTGDLRHVPEIFMYYELYRYESSGYDRFSRCAYACVMSVLFIRGDSHANRPHLLICSSSRSRPASGRIPARQAGLRKRMDPASNGYIARDVPR